VEDALGAQLAHDKAHALDHGVGETRLVHEITVKTSFGQAAAAVSNANSSTAHVPFEDRTETFQARSSLIGSLLHSQLKEQLVDPLEALLSERLGPVLVFAKGPLVDLGQYRSEIISDNVGPIDRGRRRRRRSEAAVSEISWTRKRPLTHTMLAPDHALAR
jgi:hypothetical protein